MTRMNGTGIRSAWIVTCIAGLMAVSAATLFEDINGFEPHFVLPDNQTNMDNILDYGAVPDDGADDTDAFVSWFESPSRRLYIPEGTYLVSSQLRLYIPSGKKKVQIFGERRSTTIIRLAANSEGFGDPDSLKAFIHTRQHNVSPEQNFHNYIQHLTIEIGPGNPGAVALNYHTNNTGALKDITIRTHGSHAVRPRIGLACDDYHFGTGLVRYVSVQGFETGVYIGSCKNHCTLEHIRVSDCRIGVHACGIPWYMRYDQGDTLYWSEAVAAGLDTSSIAIDGYGVSMRGIETHGCDVAVQCDIGDTTKFGHRGHAVIVDSRFLDGTGGSALVNNHADILAYSIECTGYDMLVDSRGSAPDVAAGATAVDTIGHYTSEDPVYAWEPAQAHRYRSLGIPAQESPEYQYPQSASQWAVMEAHTDITDELQAAIDNGVETIFIQEYDTISSTIIVRNNVTRIMGLGKATRTTTADGVDPTFRVVDGTSDAVIFDMFYWFGHIQHDAPRTVVFRHGHAVYSHTANAEGATEFFESTAGHFEFRNMHVYMRDANSVNRAGYCQRDTNIVNNGGQLWILGQKVEDYATKLMTINGGYTELLGGTYRQNWDEGDCVLQLLDNTPLFDIRNSHVSLSFATWKAYWKDDAYNFKHLVWESRDGTKRTLMHKDYDAQDGIDGDQALFVGYTDDVGIRYSSPRQLSPAVAGPRGYTQVSVFNVKGQCVYRKTLSATASQTTHLHRLRHRLPHGVYTVFFDNPGIEDATAVYRTIATMK
jgi:hypothetical protein